MACGIQIGQLVRLATVKRTSERFIVQRVIFDRSLVECLGDMVGFGFGTKKLDVKFDGLKDFSRDSVEIKDIKLTLPLVNELFNQTRLTSKRDILMSGEYEVLKKAGMVTIRKCPMTEYAHASLVCPDHGCSMRMRRNPRGGEFWGCSSRGETECNVSCSADTTKWYNTKRSD